MKNCKSDSENSMPHTPLLHHSMRPRAGFTFMEILVTLIIIMILASLVGISVLRKPGEARAAAAKMQIKTLQTAIRLYHAEQKMFPSEDQGLDALVSKPTRGRIPESYPDEGYLDSRLVPVDPWGTPYIYLVPGRHGEPFEIISYGADGEPGGEGEAADISSSDA